MASAIEADPEVLERNLDIIINRLNVTDRDMLIALSALMTNSVLTESELLRLTKQDLDYILYCRKTYNVKLSTMADMGVMRTFEEKRSVSYQNNMTTSEIRDFVQRRVAFVNQNGLLSQSEVDDLF